MNFFEKFFKKHESPGSFISFNPPSPDPNISFIIELEKDRQYKKAAEKFVDGLYMEIRSSQAQHKVQSNEAFSFAMNSKTRLLDISQFNFEAITKKSHSYTFEKVSEVEIDLSLSKPPLKLLDIYSFELNISKEGKIATPEKNLNIEEGPQLTFFTSLQKKEVNSLQNTEGFSYNVDYLLYRLNLIKNSYMKDIELHSQELVTYLTKPKSFSFSVCLSFSDQILQKEWQDREAYQIANDSFYFKGLTRFLINDANHQEDFSFFADKKKFEIGWTPNENFMLTCHKQPPSFMENDSFSIINLERQSKEVFFSQIESFYVQSNARPNLKNTSRQNDAFYIASQPRQFTELSFSENNFFSIISQLVVKPKSAVPDLKAINFKNYKIVGRNQTKNTKIQLEDDSTVKAKDSPKTTKTVLLDRDSKYSPDVSVDFSQLNGSMMKLNVTEVKKGDNIIDKLTEKLELLLVNRTTKESTDQIYEKVKKELSEVKSLLISNKLLKEKVFEKVSNGDIHRMTFLQNTFKVIMDETFKEKKLESLLERPKLVQDPNKQSNKIPKPKMHFFNEIPIRKDEFSQSLTISKQSRTPNVKRDYEDLKVKGNDVVELPLLLK